MRLDSWMPDAGWRSERRIHVTDCPTCGEPSEFYLCDVFGCMNMDFASGYTSNTAGRFVSICADHARVAMEEKDESVD